ncbi:nucleotidyltransferase domain-containing protein [Microbulbifer sp. A4B17]|uniref:nucleotidyltransferase domain-containing protein n=1 Tax=Microbulbifer sp. A4B17 TaxID=359370 RepID=UPI0013009F50|nr:nucleotidyltransferase domain-containing protein [Microbulbifer sp. A4B17]
MESLIKDRLKSLEVERDIEIIYACESGSRAWGFESPDSDWDVRFIYKRNIQQYLTIGTPRDVVEVPFDKKLGDELDLVGWDIKKTLTLMRASNPTLIEWLFSPKVYFRNEDILESLQDLALKCWQPRALAHHYVSMGFNNYSSFIREDDRGFKEIKVKKLLYVLRSLLNALYIKEFTKIPPVDFSHMYKELLPSSENEWLLDILSSLIVKKKVLEESDMIVVDGKLDSWIQENLDRSGANSIEERPKLDLPEFDRLFRKVVGV